MESERFTLIVSKSVVPGAHVREGVLLRYIFFEAKVIEIAILMHVGLIQRVGRSSQMILTDKGSRTYHKFTDVENPEKKSNDSQLFAFFTSDKICYVNFDHVRPKARSLPM